MVVVDTSNKRKELRISVDLPVEITHYDPQGNMFTERTRIQDVSKLGCRFLMQKALERGDIVSIRSLVPTQMLLEEGQLHLYEIKWTAPMGTCWTTGALKLQDEDLIVVVFPPPNARSLPAK
jgi:hypothetical protein